MIIADAMDADVSFTCHSFNRANTAGADVSAAQIDFGL